VFSPIVTPQKLQSDKFNFKPGGNKIMKSPEPSQSAKLLLPELVPHNPNTRRRLSKNINSSLSNDFSTTFQSKNVTPVIQKSGLSNITSPMQGQDESVRIRQDIIKAKLNSLVESKIIALPIKKVTIYLIFRHLVKKQKGLKSAPLLRNLILSKIQKGRNC
jgi:hypothetical protein